MTLLAAQGPLSHHGERQTLRCNMAEQHNMIHKDESGNGTKGRHRAHICWTRHPDLKEGHVEHQQAGCWLEREILWPGHMWDVLIEWSYGLYSTERDA